MATNNSLLLSVVIQGERTADNIRALANSGAVNVTDAFGKTALIFAVERRNNSAILALIDAGADVNIADRSGRTALIFAVERRNNSAILALIDASADVNIADRSGRTALFYAARQRNNEGVVRALIDAGADVNKTDENLQTTLLYAVHQQRNNENEIRALLDAGADVNIADGYGKTALFHAVRQSSERVVRSLIDAGADVNKADKIGQTALFYAVQRTSNESKIHVLIDAGAALNITDGYGRTALFYAVQQSKNESVVLALIDAGADVKFKIDIYGKTALFYAVQQSNNESVVRALIDAGADVNITDNDGSTPLFIAVRQANNESVIRALIDAGANVNITDNGGSTALFIAVGQSNNENVVHALIRAGANVNITDNYDSSALFIAVGQSNNENVVHALIRAGANVDKINVIGQTALFCAIKASNNENVIGALIDAGADVNITDNGGSTALFIAVGQSNNENVVHALIRAGADVNITDNDGSTALSIAVGQSNNESVVHAFIEAGADVNKIDSSGQTALFCAIKASNNKDVICELIEAGSDVNTPDVKGKTVLFYAVQESDKESVVRTLIDAGADVNITDRYGETALFYAVRQSNNESVVRAMIDAGNAFVNVRNIYGRTPLFYALDYPKSARILVENGRKYSFRLKDNCNCSILNFFVDKRLVHNDNSDEDSLLHIPPDFFHLLGECKIQQVAFAEAVLNIAFCKFPELLIERSAFLTPFTSLFGMTHITTALELAGQFTENKKEMERLIVLINEKCKKGEGLSEALQLLVELGADPNSVDSDGHTALHYATGLALMGVPQEVVMEICLQLEKLGVQFNLRNHKNQTPLLFCLSGDLGDLPKENLLTAVETLVEVAGGFLSKHRSGIEERSRSGKTFFHLLLQLFQQGLDLGYKLRQDFLHEALKLLQLFSPEQLAETGIINIPDADLNSPMHQWASLEFSSPHEYTRRVTRDLTFEEFLRTILDYLLRCGARLNARNGVDQTPLHVCRTWTAVRLLLDAKANPNDVDSSGASPLLAAAKRRLFSVELGVLYPDVAEIDDPKSIWKTAIDRGLDPWTADKQGDSVLGIFVEQENFALAKHLVDVACLQKYTRLETFAVGLLNDICKDKSTRTNWKKNLVQDILESMNVPITASEPLRLCCKNIIQSGVLDNKTEVAPPSAANELSSREHHDSSINKGPPQSKRRRKDTSDHSKEVEFENSSVHCEIIKILRLHGSDGSSCLDIADTSDALKELLTKSLDLSTVSVIIPWTSTSKTYEFKLAKVARRQEYDVIHEEFWCHQEHIGSGSFGHVFVGINKKDGREVAIKRIEKVRMQRPEGKREITNLTALADCEQVVRYLNFFEDDKFAYIVLELMEGNLDEYLTDSSTFKASKSAQLCEDVVKGLKFLHAKDIIHRDLKPGNILFKIQPQVRLKIADFGLSRRLDSTATTVYSANAGTRCWIAPEVLTATHDLSKESDIFSCGLVLHYILSVQKHPFSPSDCASKGEYQIAHETEANIMNGSMEGWNRSIQLEATHLVQRMLECDKDKRPSAGKALDHPLFWSNGKKVDFLKAVGNQPEFGCPRARRLTLTPVEADLEKNISTIIVHGNWNDPMYKDMPHIYAEMTPPRGRSYDTHSVVELVRFIRNAYAHVSEATRPTPIKKLLLEDFVFLEYFPHLVMEVFKVVTAHGWDQTVEEIKYAMNK